MEETNFSEGIFDSANEKEENSTALKQMSPIRVFLKKGIPI